MFFRKLIPDYMFATYQDITPAFLQSIGIRALLIDIDNTLAPYEQPDSDEQHSLWFAAMEEAGIRTALVSNNDRARVERFNRRLSRLAFWKSGKPGGKYLRRAMHEFGVSPDETAVLGDQLFTDAIGGKYLGLTTIIVPPIRDKKTLFVRFKRYLERPFIRAYQKAHAADFENKKGEKSF